MINSWSVGELRKALADPGLRDDVPVQIVLADTPGDFTSFVTRVLVGAERDGVLGAGGAVGLQDALLLLADASEAGDCGP
ncbi:DUF6225 family protein [Streptomyces bacillaris]|uniref:DUF6225 family protein n=1 Tax=Streptomyces bacillaris TaxID=68179 RepID=UPI0035DFA668